METACVFDFLWVRLARHSSLISFAIQLSFLIVHCRYGVGMLRPQSNFCYMMMDIRNNITREARLTPLSGTFCILYLV